MNTVFTLRLVHADATLAKNAAHAAMQLIDELESHLSRYRPGSDIWQINHMQAAQSLFIHETTYECIQQALAISNSSGGLFDVTLGRQIEHKKSGIDTPPPSASGHLALDPDKPAIHCIEPGREIDLGGIGKGFALDCLKTELQEWGIEAALISSGASTHLAFGRTSWPITRHGSADKAPLQLSDQALSISGADVQGEHIIDPNNVSGESAHRPRIWVLHSSAAAADAWSTACYLMDDPSLEILKQRLTIITDAT